MNVKNIDKYNPLVSIALITYNGDKYLRKQLDSLLAQTYNNIEVVISDDGSNTETVDILNEYANLDPRVRWSRSQLDRGYIKNTQNAISLCRGEIIFLCDQDDVWFANKIRSHVDAYRDPNVTWVYNKVVLIDENDKEIGYLEDTVSDYYKKGRRKLLNYTWGSCLAAAITSYRSSALRRVMPIGDYAPAHDSWIQLAIFPAKCAFIDSVLQAYRLHGENAVGWGKKMTSDEAKKNEQLAIFENLRYLKQLPKNKNLQTWKRIFFFAVYLLKVMRIKSRLFKT